MKFSKTEIKYIKFTNKFEKAKTQREKLIIVRRTFGVKNVSKRVPKNLKKINEQLDSGVFKVKIDNALEIGHDIIDGLPYSIEINVTMLDDDRKPNGEKLSLTLVRHITNLDNLKQIINVDVYQMIVNATKKSSPQYTYTVTPSLINIKDDEVYKILNKGLKKTDETYLTELFSDQSTDEFLADHCGENIIIDECKKKRAGLTNEKLRREINKSCKKDGITPYNHFDGMTLEQIKSWVNSRGNIKLCVFDIFGKVLLNIKPIKQTKITMVMMQHNNHLTGFKSIGIKRSVFNECDDGYVHVFTDIKTPKFNKKTRIIKTEDDLNAIAIKDIFHKLNSNTINCIRGIDNVVYYYRPDFEQTMKLLNHYELEYKGQSFSRALIDVFNKKYELKSHFNSFNDNNGLIDQTYTKALVYVNNENSGRIYDMSKAYLRALQNLTYVCVYNKFDVEETYTGKKSLPPWGEAWIQAETALGPIDCRHSIETVKFLLKHKIIDESNIKTIKVAKKIISIKNILAYMTELEKFLPSKDFKRAYVTLIGMFGTRFKTTRKTAIVDDETTAKLLAGIHECGMSKSIDGRFYIYKEDSIRQRKDSSCVNRFVVSECVRLMFEKWISIDRPLVSWVNTDSFCVQCDNCPIGMTEKPGEYPPKCSDFMFMFFDKHWDIFTEYEKDGLCIVGPPGSGKSTLLKKMHSEESGLVLSPTHSAKNQLGIAYAHTVSWFNSKYADKTYNGVVYIDEIFQCCSNVLSEFDDIHTGVLYSFGDPNQLSPVESVKYDYLKNSQFSAMHGNNFKNLKFISGQSRNCQKLYDLSQQVLKTGIVHEMNIDIDAQLHIVSTNELRVKLNKQSNTSEYVVVKRFLYQKKYYDKGQRFFIDRNDGDYLIFLDGKKEVIVPSKYMQKYFAITDYKSQGSTIEKPYMIHIEEFTNKNGFYTSLTRARKIDNVGVVWECGKRILKSRKYEEFVILTDSDFYSPK